MSADSRLFPHTRPLPPKSVPEACVEALANRRPWRNWWRDCDRNLIADNVVKWEKARN